VNWIALCVIFWSLPSPFLWFYISGVSENGTFATSIEVRLGKRKGVLNQFHSRLCIVRDYDFHHVEPEKDVGVIEHAHPRERTSRNSLALFPIDCFHGTAEIFATARFHFDKDQCVIVTADNVYLPTRAATEIA